MKRLLPLKHVIWLFIPLLFAWALRDVSLSEVGAVLGRLSITQIALLVGLNLFILVLFSSRWWLISRRQGYRIPYLSLVAYRLAAFGISYYTPGPQFGGEPLQVLLLRRRHDLPMDTALAGVTLDKLVELSVNFTVLFAGLVLILLGSSFGVSSLVLFAALVFILPLLYLSCLMLGAKPLSSLLQRLKFFFARSPALTRLIAAAIRAEDQAADLASRQPYTIIVSIALSALIWMLAILEYHLMLAFLGVSLTLPQAIGLLTVARLAFLTPLPGGIGALEAGQVLALSALGFDPALGISASLLIRARDLTLGGFGLFLAFILTRSDAAQPLSTPAGD